MGKPEKSIDNACKELKKIEKFIDKENLTADFIYDIIIALDILKLLI